MSPLTSFNRFLNKLKRALGLAKSPRTPTNRVRLNLEQLEDRITPASITWINAASGSWQTAANWDLNRAPTVGDDVVIPDIGNNGANLTITYDSGSTTIQSLTTAENFTLSGGTLTFAGGTQSLTLNAGMTLTGSGTVVGGTINATGANHLVANNYGVLDGVTLNGTLDLGSFHNLFVRNNLTLTNGSVVNQTGGGAIQFDNSGGASSNQFVQMAPGGGAATFNWGSGQFLQSGTAHSVTFGSGVTVRGWGFVHGMSGNPTWNNAGTFSADLSGSTLDLLENNTFRNLAGGVWETKAGGILNIAHGRTNATWSNAGIIKVDGGTLNLGGTISPTDAGFVNGVMPASRFTRTGGTVGLTGKMVNTGTEFALDATTGPWNLHFGTIVGGTVNTTGANSLVGRSGVLDDVTLNGTLAVNGFDVLTVRNNLTLANGSVVNQNGGTINFDNTGGGSSNQFVQMAPGATTATFNWAPGQFGQTGTAHSVTFGAGVIVHGWGFVHGISGNPTWNNAGTFSADLPGTILSFEENNTLRNLAGGVWETKAGATLSIATSRTNATWSNRGVINVDGGTLNLGGTFTPEDAGFVNGVMDPARFTRSGGTVNVTSLLINTGNKFTLDAITGSWILRDFFGTIRGGRINATGAQHLVANSYGILDDVTLNGTLDVITGANVTVRNNLTLTDGSSVNQASGSTLVFDNTAGGSSDQFVQMDPGGGAATINWVSGQFDQSGTAHRVTIGKGVTLRGNGRVFGGSAATWTNAGAISPGALLGVITVHSNYVQSSTGALNLDIQGTNAFTPDFDQLVVNGAVTLGGALNVLPLNNYVPALGTTFKIIDNDGTEAVVDTFAGIPQGGTLTVNDGGVYRIDYSGGTGNDVVLTFIGYPPVVATNNAAVSVEKGQTASSTGTFSDPDGNTTVTLTASIGSVTKNANGTWTWSAPTGSLALGNYSVIVTATDSYGLTTTTTITLTVNPASTSSTINAPTITYGAAGSVTVTVTSALGIVTGNVSLTVDGGSPITLALTIGSAAFSMPGLTAGTHALASTYAAQGDFAASAATGTLTVNKAQLSVAVDDKTKVYGAAVPYLTGTLSGVVNNDAISVSYYTTATAASDVVVGGYPITATLNDPNGRLGNYTVTNTPGALTITKADQSILWNNPADIVYGTALSGTQLNAIASVVGPSLAGALTYSPAAGTVLAAGAGRTLTVSAAATNNYNSATASVVVNVTPATLTVSAENKSRVYGETNPALTATISGFVNGDTATVVSGAPVLSTTATASSPVASYPITATVGTLAAANYQFAFVNGALIVNRADTAVVVTTPGFATLYGVDDVSLSAAVSVVAPGSGSPTGTVTFYDGATMLGVANLIGGVASTIVDRNVLAAGSRSITATFSGDANFNGSSGSATHVVLAPSTVQGLVYVDSDDDGQVDFGETAVAGVTITLNGTDDRGNSVNRSLQTDSQGVYTFTNLRPSNAAGYTVTETQPSSLADGRDTVGTIGVTTVGSMLVNDTISGVVITQDGSYAQNYNFGERQAASGAVAAGQTATIGFWQNKNGQNLIKALNGGATSTQLGNWLAANFPNMYGAGANNLAGKTNEQVAAFYQRLFARTTQNSPGGPPKTDAQVLATAFAVYVTNQSLAGNTATAFGFQVSATGVGARTFNVGSNGTAFGVTNNSNLGVMELLLAVNARSSNGLLYDLNGDGQITGWEITYRTMANDVFSAINEAGDI